MDGIRPDEAARLEVLARYDILDTAPEEAFSDLAILAAQLCGAPIALVSLVDAGRQWFKAAVGIEAAETPRDASFCAHAISARMRSGSPACSSSRTPVSMGGSRRTRW